MTVPALETKSSATLSSQPGSGLGKGKGLQTQTKRHARKREELKRKGLSRRDIQRTARRGGVKRMTGEIPGEARKALDEFLRKIIGTAVCYLEYANKKTFSRTHVDYALKYHHVTLLSAFDTDNFYLSGGKKTQTKSKSTSSEKSITMQTNEPSDSQTK